MGRGTNHHDHTERRLKETADQLYGRLETQIEFYARARTLDPMALTRWVGTLLFSGGQWPEGAMSDLRLEAGSGRAWTPALEGALEPHGGASQNGVFAGTGEATPDKEKRVMSTTGLAALRKAQKARWAKHNAAKKAEEAKKKKKTAKKDPKRVNIGQQVKSYWAAMTPEQRSEEVKRRFRVREANRKAAA